MTKMIVDVRYTCPKCSKSFKMSSKIQKAENVFQLLKLSHSKRCPGIDISEPWFNKYLSVPLSRAVARGLRRRVALSRKRQGL